ncbi:MAG: DUF502 domain-containing protein [Fidelibacterota bacterium]|nr:MAG: DUF502 domain-containing protein [Candidatus Neomarinimicrobiota bacterium]
MGAKIRRIFVAGIFTAIPVYATIKVMQILFRFMDQILAPLIQRFLGYDIPGLGLVMLIITLFFLGLFVTNFLGRRMYNFLERFVLRVPIVSSIYNFAKQIVQTFSPEHRSAFKKVVWLEYPRPGLWTLGFVTGTSFSADGVPYYNVFVATTPNPTSGYVVFVAQHDTIEATLTIEEGFKLLISGGALSRGSHQFRFEFKPEIQLDSSTGETPARLTTGEPASTEAVSAPRRAKKTRPRKTPARSDKATPEKAVKSDRQEPEKATSP